MRRARTSGASSASPRSSRRCAATSPRWWLSATTRWSASSCRSCRATGRGSPASRSPRSGAARGWHRRCCSGSSGRSTTSACACCRTCSPRRSSSPTAWPTPASRADPPSPASTRSCRSSRGRRTSSPSSAGTCSGSAVGRPRRHALREAAHRAARRRAARPPGSGRAPWGCAAGPSSCSGLPARGRRRSRGRSRAGSAGLSSRCSRARCSPTRPVRRPPCARRSSKIRRLERVLVFIDEVEKEITSARGDRSPVHGLTNELLKVVPEFRRHDERLLVCATNDLRSLDPAFTAPGASTTSSRSAPPTTPRAPRSGSGTPTPRR